jgi:hypothetical protein
VGGYVYCLVGEGSDVSLVQGMGEEIANAKKKCREHQHVILKIYARNEDIENEFGIYQHLMNVKSKSQHPGVDFIRTALNTFVIPRPGGDHNCLVQPPMWES